MQTSCQYFLSFYCILSIFERVVKQNFIRLPAALIYNRQTCWSKNPPICFKIRSVRRLNTPRLGSIYQQILLPSPVKFLFNTKVHSHILARENFSSSYATSSHIFLTFVVNLYVIFYSFLVYSLHYYFS